ncbi:MAG: hypothetical protein D6730_03710 [Bacteroidetes bacterium]|nr:MAG: hypothetical protein D6730_03710 [Bacteroidota bacterium]
MNYQDILTKASKGLKNLKGNVIDVVEVKKPPTLDYARHLAKIVSKLSPLVGNMIEYHVCVELNKLDWGEVGSWKRQDPGFPDTVFEGNINPAPGIEIKTWFPLATEITARFKDSINHFKQNQTYVALLAWLPEFIIYGKPKIIDVWVDTAWSLAKARDAHYHRPPDYLIFEPENTSERAANLQQSNTNGYKFQGDAKAFQEAEKIVAAWGKEGKRYSPSRSYQKKLRQLRGKYPYRLDTNYAKIDRIGHQGVENFKTHVLDSVIHQHSLREWSKLIKDEEWKTMDWIKNLM